MTSHLLILDKGIALNHTQFWSQKFAFVNVPKKIWKIEKKKKKNSVTSHLFILDKDTVLTHTQFRSQIKRKKLIIYFKAWKRFAWPVVQ